MLCLRAQFALDPPALFFKKHKRLANRYVALSDLGFCVLQEFDGFDDMAPGLGNFLFQSPLAFLDCHLQQVQPFDPHQGSFTHGLALRRTLENQGFQVILHAWHGFVGQSAGTCCRLPDRPSVIQPYARTEFDTTASMKGLKLMKLALMLRKVALDQASAHHPPPKSPDHWR